MQQKIVITGGPGTGKSTIIHQLMQMEFTCMPEISRMITREAQKTGVDQLFLKDPLIFSELLLNGRIQQFMEADQQKDSKVFFDRGLPDVHGYLDFIGTNYPSKFTEQSFKLRYSHVFMLPPWKEIYQNDNERYETFEESLRIYEFLLDAYRMTNYQIVTVPEGSIDQRVNFILNSL